ncbi:conserved unknown protein [Ectocarpus siliculosus]|uniref:PKD/REJ-like domain-containing protein n=1 Tax=Ectocarpus siliculosus TaxID=2880 RepID=D7FJB7_ECTSI|nr:conserved unknown protein [Ectocarpus siliculosus]|eukprot:CBJ29023.1 conserved unknown protein [Ectocarpus siliculosus]
MLPPELSSARFSDTGQQVFVYFEGSESSREVNGNYAPAACEEVFSNTSAVTLGIGCTSQFTSASTLAMEAFLSSEPGCVAVGPALNPNEPVVEISAPEVVGCCSNLILEGVGSYPSTDIELNWTIEATDGNGTFDLTDARAAFEQIAGSASRKHWRGLQLTIRTEVSLPRVENGNNTYAWTVLSESSATADFPPIVLTSGRNPSVLTLPPYTLGYAGSAYVFRVDLADGIQSATSATATVEVVSGAIIAYIAGGTARRLGASQTILRKYNPSEKIVLYACASSSPEGPCDSSTSSSFGLTWRQENGNLDLRNGWTKAFSTPVNARTLVTRKGALGAGQVYSFSLSATDASGLVGYAEFSFETNAPPSGGHLKSDRLSATAGVNPVVLQTLGWTDDIDDLPLTYSFGYIQGYHEVIAIASSESALVNRLSSSPSVSTTLTTNVPAGLSRNEFNLTIVVSASDTLGSTAATNLGEDGAPMVVTSVAPEEASLLPLAYNLTCYPGEPSCQNGSLPYPEDTLRDARVATALLQHVPLTTSDGVESTSSLQEIGSSAESTLSEASSAAADMVDRVANHGAVLDDAAAVSLVLVTSALFDGLSASPTTSNEGAAFAENGDQLALLADVGNALAFGSEAEEELGETSAGSLVVQPAKVHSMDMSATTISVGPNGTHISFSSWDAAIGSDQDFGGARTFSVAGFSSTGSDMDGVTVVDAWDSAGVPEKQFSWPIDLSMAIPEPDAIDLGADIEKGDVGHLGCGYWSEESGSWETDGVVLGSLERDLDSTAAVIQCATYHLTAFTSRVDSTTPQWNTLDLVTDFTVLAQVRDRAQAARQALMEDRARERDGNVFHHMPVVFKNEKNMSKVAAESVLFNHSWRHLSESPTAHFSKTLLTRSQHLVLLLADWMSAILLQAIFYGKSQFGVRKKVEMTVISALLMLPTGVIFPALLRAGNTPPASQTLKRVPVRQEEPEGPNHDLYDELQRKQEERVDDFRTALQDARSSAREQMHRGGFSAPRDSPPRKTAPTRFVANVRRSPNEFYFSATNATPVVQTAAYRDVVAMQKTLLLVYLPLPMLLAMLVSEQQGHRHDVTVDDLAQNKCNRSALVLRISREAEAAGGDEYAFLHNMVTSLSVACSVLCALSAFAVVSRSARIMVQTTTFQAVVAPGLALCGVLMYNSSASIAAGAVLGAAVALVGSYLVGVQRKYEDILNELIEGDLVAAWSQPTREMHMAAEIVQRCYRVPWRLGIPTIDQASIRPCNRRSCSQLVTWSVESFATAGAGCYHMQFGDRAGRPDKDWLRLNFRNAHVLHHWVITIDADSAQPLAWSNTGYWNPSSAGLYSFIDLDSGGVDELRGLMLRPGSSDIHVLCKYLHRQGLRWKKQNVLLPRNLVKMRRRVKIAPHTS